MIKPQLTKDRKTFRNIELPDYIAEKKYDGERIIAIKEGNDIILQRRSGKDATKQYPEIVEALHSFDYDIILDGEMVVFKDGKDDFPSIQSRTHLKDEQKIYTKSIEEPATYIVFDILKAFNANLREKPWYIRHDYLTDFYERSIANTPSEHYIDIIMSYDDPVELFDTAVKEEWEGIVLKPKYSMYIENDRKEWIKMKNTYDADFIFTDYEENNRGIKLLKYTTHEKDDIILTVDKDNPLSIQCGGQQSEEVKELLDKDGEILVTITYLNVTNDYRLRMPVFKKLVDLTN